MNNHHWWSLEFWFRSRDESRDPFLQVSVSKVSGLVSVSKSAGLETLNIAKKWYSKISIIQQILFVVFAGKKQPKPVRKNARSLKNIQLRSNDIFLKIRQNAQILKSRVSVSGFLMRSRSRSFNQIPISKVTVSTTSLIFIFFYFGTYVTKCCYSCLQFKAEICTRQECDWLKFNFIARICSINSIKQLNHNRNLKIAHKLRCTTYWGAQTEVHNLLRCTNWGARPTEVHKLRCTT